MKHLFQSKVFLSLATAALLAFGFAGPAQADAPYNELLTFEAPFAFEVSDTELPAGTYVIESVDPQEFHRMTIESKDSDANVAFLVKQIPDSWDTDDLASRSARVVFEEIDGTQHLAELWIPAHSNALRLLSEVTEDDGVRTEVKALTQEAD